METVNNKKFLAFIPSDNFLTWHRAPLLEAIRARCEKDGVDFMVWQRPVSFFKIIKLLSKKRRTEKPHYVKDLYTVLPASLVSRSRLAFLLFFAFPIFLQLRSYLKDTTIIWFCKPSQFEFLKYYKGKFLFEIYDNYAADNEGLALVEKETLKKDFESTIRQSQHVFFSNIRLFLESDNLKKVYLPNAVSSALIDRGPVESVVEKSSNQVVIGFVGVLSNQINIEALTTILTEKPNWKIEIVGKIDNDVADKIEGLVRLFPNLEVLGPYYYDELSKYVPYFTVGLCPYIENSFNNYRNPMKIYEFAAFGVPTVVLGCQLDNEQSKICYEATLSNIVSTIEIAIKEKNGKRGEILKFARENTWDIRANTLREYF